MIENQQELKDSIDKLESELKIIAKQLRGLTSVKRIFLISVLKGFASALGATVVFGLVFAGVIQIIRSIDYVPILNGFLSSGAIEELIKKFSQSL